MIYREVLKLRTLSDVDMVLFHHSGICKVFMEGATNKSSLRKPGVALPHTTPSTSTFRRHEVRSYPSVAGP